MKTIKIIIFITLGFFLVVRLVPKDTPYCAICTANHCNNDYSLFSYNEGIAKFD